jgi:hypothetical protein
MRWRRLQEKIARDHGPAAGLLGNTAIVASTTQTQNTANLKKRRADPVEMVIESDSEHDNKRVKLEGAETDLNSDRKEVKMEEVDVKPEKRQTRDKKLGLKYMLDNCSSSGAGTSSIAPTTSLYEDSAAEQADDEEYLDSEVEEKLNNRKQTKASAAASPVKSGKVRKVPKVEAPITPMSAARSALVNLSPTPSLVTATDDVRPMPTPTSFTFPVLVKSIESDDHTNVQAELGGFREGGFVQANGASHSTVISTSREYFDSAMESVVPPGASSVEVQAPTEADPMELDDMVSVSPNDSISMVGTMKLGGIQRKSADVPKKGTRIFFI